MVTQDDLNTGQRLLWMDLKKYSPGSPDLSPRDVNESFAIAYIQTALICRLKISCIGPDFPYQLIAAIGL